MVQEYVLQGVSTTKSVDEWMNGFDADFIGEMASGDFNLGNDYDLVKTITPILST